MAYTPKEFPETQADPKDIEYGYVDSSLSYRVDFDTKRIEYLITLGKQKTYWEQHGYKQPYPEDFDETYAAGKSDGQIVLARNVLDWLGIRNWNKE